MSATLYREGDDLAVLLAELDEQYPGQVRVVAVERPRVGGVLGFFARLRVGVHYELTDAPLPAPAPALEPAFEPAPVPAPGRVLQTAGYGALSELIAAAEAAEAAAVDPVAAARARAPEALGAPVRGAPYLSASAL
ncbi:MAG: hypothetical protein QOK11_2567, partial [Pseudonocardiales bacterium]|nr:hypothetical protein [Pseudonocardiales bacterium]